MYSTNIAIGQVDSNLFRRIYISITQFFEEACFGQNFRESKSIEVTYKLRLMTATSKHDGQTKTDIVAK